MRTIASTTLALFAVSCGPQDGHDFTGSEFEHRDQRVIVVEHESISDLRAAAPRQAKGAEHNLYGYSLIWPDRCEIHVTKLISSDARMWLGHEMTHCVHGRWHN